MSCGLAPGRLVEHLGIAEREDVEPVRGVALLGDGVAARERRVLQPLGDLGLLAVRQPGEELHRVEHLEAPGQLALLHRLGVRLVALHRVDVCCGSAMRMPARCSVAKRCTRTIESVASSSRKSVRK
jgi:hypothetical protein